MRSLGTKTVTVGGLLALTFIIAFNSGRLQPDYLLELTGQSSFILGLFTVLMGMWFYRLSDLGNPSRTYFRLAKKTNSQEQETFLLEAGKFALIVGRRPGFLVNDLPPALMRISSFAICFLLASLCFNTYTSDLIFETPKRLNLLL